MKNFGIIFDMDGTMIHNMPYHLQAFKVFAKRHGVDVGSDEEFLSKTSGQTNDAIMPMVFGTDISPEKILEYSDEKEAIYRELYRPHLRLTKGLIELLASLSEAEIPLCVGSSAPDENIALVLDGLNIRRFFAAVINSSQIAHGKPHPEVFLKAAAAMQLSPARCVVVEDALLGIEAARRAQMKVMAVAQMLPIQALTPVADVVVEDFCGVSAATFEAMLR